MYRRARKKQTPLSHTADFCQYYGDMMREVFERLDEAEALYREGLTLDPAHTGILMGLVELYLAKANQEPDECSRHNWNAQEACNAAERVLDQQLEESDDPQYRLRRAKLLLLFDSDEEAENYLVRALEGDEERAAIYNSLGVVYARKEDFQEAARNFKEARRRKPDDMNVGSNLAAAYLKLNLKDKAEAEYKRILRKAPGHVESHIGLGEVYLAMGGDDGEMYHRALRCFTKALEIADSTRGSKKLRGKDRADVMFSRAYARVMSYENASITAKDEQQLRGAEQDFKICFELDPDNHDAERNREKLAKRLSGRFVGRFVDKVAPWVIFVLSLLVFIFSQLNFYFPGSVCKEGLIKNAGYYALLTFGSLVFMVAGLYLPQILKLKVGGIEMEKKPFEQMPTSVSLGMTWVAAPPRLIDKLAEPVSIRPRDRFDVQSDPTLSDQVS